MVDEYDERWPYLPSRRADQPGGIGICSKASRPVMWSGGGRGGIRVEVVAVVSFRCEGKDHVAHAVNIPISE